MLISEAIDPQTRTAKVRVSVANPDGRLKAEMFASINLEIAAGARQTFVPARALFTEDGRSYVFVQADDTGSSEVACKPCAGGDGRRC